MGQPVFVAVLAFVTFSAMFTSLLCMFVYMRLRSELCMSCLLRQILGVKTSFPFLSPFWFYCNVVVLVLVCVSFFPPSVSPATFGMGHFSLLVSKSAPCLHSLSACWLGQVSPCPRMPLHPQQPSAFCLQLPETVPELLCLCTHAHLHWYAEAGKNEEVISRWWCLCGRSKLNVYFYWCAVDWQPRRNIKAMV